MHFSAAYTPCPLCVPARMAMMSGMLPSKIGILTNNDTLPDTTPTFAHSMAAAGYETVLIGRMHFIGRDQRHGFQHRLVGDTTPVTWNRPLEKLTEIRGVHRDSFGEPKCTVLMGGGDSPVMEYDKQVVQAAIEWLDRPHEKPQLIVVGTYGPHFPYIAPVDKYIYYKDRISLPAYFKHLPQSMDPFLRTRGEKNKISEEEALQALAANCGLIELTDEYLSKVRNAFFKSVKENGREGILMYLSDHGDQCGERRLYGKMSFYEKSARIPWLMEGDSISAGKTVSFPVSLLDVGPTVCALGDAIAPPRQDGLNILAGGHNLSDRPVISELLGTTGMYQLEINTGQTPKLSRMVRQNQYKFITRFGHESHDALYDIIKNPEEDHNLLNELPDAAETFRTYLKELPAAEQVEGDQYLRAKANQLLALAESAMPPADEELWQNNPDTAKSLPTVI